MPRDSQQAGSGLSRRGLVIAGIAALLAVVAVVGTGIANRGVNDERRRQWTEAQAAPTVGIVLPRVAGGISALDLPGRLEAYARAPIYARVSGYIKTWAVDIGDVVKAGQLLAEIDAPDLDQQFLQARAALASAQASEALAQITAQRWQQLAGTSGVSRQAVDEKMGDLTVKQAQTRAAQAALDRLEVIASYKRVVAPFDGIVTTRNTDLGALINADSSAGLALFVISDISRLRLYVNVPQNFVPAIKLNAVAQITVPEYPGRSWQATVVASARAVDAASGTTRFQLVVDNAAGELMPGGYAAVKFDLPANTTTLEIPSSALIIDQAGIRVIVVSADNRVSFRTVTIARDLGRVIEISDGLKPGDRVVESPPDGLVDGDSVRVVDNAGPQSRVGGAPGR